MADWPSDLPYANANFSEVIHRPAIRSRSDAGYLVTRPRWTAKKREFNLVFKGLSRAQMEQIITFFDSIGWGGEEFNYVNPADDETYVVKLMDDEVEFQYLADDVYSVKVNFMEV
jgi:hypothetical protein